MMKKLWMWILAARIENRWKQIGRNRKKMERLLSEGAPYSSPALVRLDGSTAKLGYGAKKLEARYRALMGTGRKAEA